MNRLIILGNGFDLAHNIKTSFNQFILDYLCNAVNTFYSENRYVDPLLEIRFKYANQSFGQQKNPANKENVYKLLEQLDYSSNYHFQIKSDLLRSIHKKTSKLKWVDIEVEFFNILLKAKQQNNPGSVDKINDDLDFLKTKLIEYLKNQEDSFSNVYDKEDLVECFCQVIYPHEIVTTELQEKQFPENLYFLNFNYTKTIEDYYERSKKKIKSEINYIHGNLGGIHGQPIFGFGDELDKKYIEFEDEHNNSLFKHIKSFEYSKTKNYYLLIRFIESNDFQVSIYGHSCGISDRTMLNEIFEHENCKSIKVFYHKVDDDTNDYTEKIFEISRHFKNKGLMRKKIIPFDLSQEMPQPKQM